MNKQLSNKAERYLRAMYRDNAVSNLPEAIADELYERGFIDMDFPDDDDEETFVCSITHDGINYLEATTTDRIRYLLPLIVSILALAVSVWSLLLHWL